MMNLAEQAELDRILAGSDHTESNETTKQLGPSSELIGFVTTPTKDTVSVEGMAPRDGREGEMQIGGGPCQGPSLSL